MELGFCFPVIGSPVEFEGNDMMKETLVCFGALLLGAVVVVHGDDARGAKGDVPEEALAGKGELVFSDDFEGDDLGEWKVVIPGFHVRDGVLVGKQDRADHGAVGRVYRPMKDVVVQFKFRLDGSKTFNAVFDDQKWKGSHAGHICRVAFAPTRIRLGDDKEGIMRHDIFAMRRNPARKGEAEKLLEGRISSAVVELEQRKWYEVAIEIVGDAMRVSLDGQPVGYLKSPGLGHETKSSFHFTVPGPGVEFDEVRIWEAR